MVQALRYQWTMSLLDSMQLMHVASMRHTTISMHRVTAVLANLSVVPLPLQAIDSTTEPHTRQGRGHRAAQRKQAAARTLR